MILPHMRILLFLSVWFVPAAGFAAWLKCYVELDTDEIIMNYDVLPPEQAKVPGVEIMGRESGTDEWIRESLTFEKEQSFQLRLHVPDDSLQNVQYVMEVSAGARFVPANMCEGRRTHAARHDTPVTLQVDGNSDEVVVWAGWATGHEAVSLTPKLILKRTEASHEL
jgi:hypothetical protein